MNTVYVTTPTGISFTFKSRVCNFIDNVRIAVGRLEHDYGYKTEVTRMGTDFTVSVY